ncbi:hypothetical protein [Edaphovirga cremea]|uniref:hypothetical protein n=1 Tax=Edaphovirga cremea TaxID=2267246 RepID=UPI003988E4FD
MAESLAQRLQRIAREKAASAAGGASVTSTSTTQPVAQPTQVTQAQVIEEVSDVKQDGLAQVSSAGNEVEAGTGSNDRAQESVSAMGESTESAVKSVPEVSSEVESNSSDISTGVGPDNVSNVASSIGIEETKVAILGMELARVDEEVKAELAPVESKPTSTHPLAMAFAELEAGLLARDPEFKTKLRDIHRHLGREPELVTQMTEAEIALIVTGMVVFANAEIVEPAAKKAGKAAVKAASKVVISADDL